jgi:hypothetical protein
MEDEDDALIGVVMGSSKDLLMESGLKKLQLQ